MLLFISYKWVIIFRHNTNNPLGFHGKLLCLTGCFRLLIAIFKTGFHHRSTMRSITLFKTLFILLGIHSLCVGAGLILIPLSAYSFFGFGEYYGSFFKIQGGVFHIIMGSVYIVTATDPQKYRSFIYLTIAAKLTATVFLLGYYFLAERIWMVLVSGLGDLVMGLAVLSLFRHAVRREGR